MGPYESGDSPPAGFGVLLNLALSEAPDCPTFTRGHFVKAIVSLRLQLSMPVIAIRLNNELDRFKHEVGLEPPEHRFVHLELQAALLELVL